MPKAGTVLVLGAYQQTIALVRSLARDGYPVAVGREGPRNYVEWSRHVREVVPHPEVASGAAFRGFLREFLARRTDVAYVFPVGETELLALASCWEGEVPRRAVMPDPEVVATCLNKVTANAVASRLGIPLPETRTAASALGLRAAAGQVGLPCVLKPEDASRLLLGEKAVVCRDREDLDQAVFALADDPGVVLVQRWVPGCRHNCQFAAVHGFRNQSDDRPGRKLVFYISCGIGGIGDPGCLLDHIEQPQQLCLPAEPSQEDRTTAAAGLRQVRVVQPRPQIPKSIGRVGNPPRRDRTESGAKAQADARRSARCRVRSH